MRVSVLRRQEQDTPTHFTPHMHVSKDRLVMADDYAYVTFVLAGTGLLEGKQQLSTIQNDIILVC